MDTKLFGNRMKDRRTELGISAAYIAKTTGLNKATIHRYENGEFSKVKLPTIEAIANILDVNPGWLIGKSEEKHISHKKYTSNDVCDIINLTLTELNKPNLLLEGKVLSHESQQSLINTIQVGLELARKLNQ